MDKRYQVFVSSTYTDLVDERHSIMLTLMKMDCIPAGMEHFPAADEEQWNFIKRIIDYSDYYLLIIGGRYGSLDNDGLSFTEKEYNYAVEKNIKVVALIHGSPETLTFQNSEQDPALREKLQAFRDRVKTKRLVEFWTNPSELPGKVALGIMNARTMHPATGWVRADKITNEENLNEIIKAKNEIENLNKIILDLKGVELKDKYGDDLAGLDDSYKVNYMEFSNDNFITEHHKSISLNLGRIFDTIAPKAEAGCVESNISIEISDMITSLIGEEDISTSIYNDEIITLRMHFIALELIQFDSPWWSLTAKGRDQMIKRRVIRKQPSS